MCPHSFLSFLLAENFNPGSNIPDGTCIYPPGFWEWGSTLPAYGSNLFSEEEEPSGGDQGGGGRRTLGHAGRAGGPGV